MKRAVWKPEKKAEEKPPETESVSSSTATIMGIGLTAIALVIFGITP